MIGLCFDGEEGEEANRKEHGEEKWIFSELTQLLVIKSAALYINKSELVDSLGKDLRNQLRLGKKGLDIEGVWEGGGEADK